MRYLIRIKERDSRVNLLEAVKTLAGEFGAEAKNPKRTSYGALELDIFATSSVSFERFVASLAPLGEPEFTRDLNVPMQFRMEAELFSEARSLFNAERYWECHEVLEGAWRVKDGDEKRQLQGMILVCAAFVHHQKGEDSVALGILERAVRLLNLQNAQFGAFRVDLLKAEAEQILTTRNFFCFTV
ncbi:MAG: DUF309 domain-containing protein [Nitrososphaerota archaeon]|nr:DUF309 domain-containing protein [Nitrososphaerota archaeon]MDG6942310.1 DUF309 domain-containing protein [Nitrososphaerota archaeon]MDG6942775.1 DUF309 domain-containing protein [Nitrososphaerota archaeon]MDG6948562.1 DUF309 domain-containing protein [Nitrososphaerota archaeon]MDG6950488.1 DUF309 domain-containing protein [Nitrososphaerota archaeon]